MGRYTVTFSEDPKTTLAAMYAAGRHLFGGRRRIFPVLNTVLSCVLVPAGGLVMVLALRHMVGLDPFPGDLAVMVAIGAGFGLLNWWLARQTYLELAKASARSAMGREVMVTLDPAGVRLRGGASDWFNAWADIDAILHKPNLIGFVVGGIVFFVPTGAFADADETRAALQHCRDWHAAAQGG